MEEIRAWVQVVGVVITAISTTVQAYRAIVQQRQYKIEKEEARKQGVDPERVENE